MLKDYKKRRVKIWGKGVWLNILQGIGLLQRGHNNIKLGKVMQIKNTYYNICYYILEIYVIRIYIYKLYVPSVTRDWFVTEGT